MKTMLKSLWKEEEGQDLIEYSLLVALIALVGLAAFPAIGHAVSDVFSDAITCFGASGCA